MAKSVTVKMDKKGIGEILKSDDMRQMVDDAASKMQQQVKQDLPEGTEVTVQDYTTDRAAASVGIEDVLGMVYQAQHGTLTKAAKSIGAEVKEKGK